MLELSAERFSGDWHPLIQLASNELLLPSLWSHAKKLNLQAQLDPELAELLQTAESLNAERNARILQEACHAAKLLNSIGIEPVALKGLAYIFTGVYPNAGARFLQDIDLLIPVSSLAPAVQVLTANGFLPDETDPLAPLRQHSPGLQRPFGPTIELHHVVGLGVCQRLLPTAELLRDSMPHHLSGAKFRVPSPTHLANHLILHSQLSHPYRDRVFPPLRALYDLQILCETAQIDWPAILQRYRKEGQYLTLALHLKEAERVLGLRPPFQVELNDFGHIRWCHRRLLARHPRWRFADPFYVLPCLFARRFRMLGEVVRHPEHWSHFAKALANPVYYRNLLRL